MKLFTYKDPKKAIFNTIYIFLGLFVLIMGYFTYFLVAKSGEVINSTYNKRQEVLSERITRGEILSSEGDILAKTVVDADGNETREYPYNEVFAHVVGRFSKGKTGIEESENIRLLTSNLNSFELMYSDLVGEKSPGDNIVTTLNTKLQQVAYDALGNYIGAVVVMEPSTGKVLAMVSKPSYDPNKIDALWDDLIADDETDSPLFNRATQGRYEPGSTFKVLTALEYMREDPSYRLYEYKCTGSIEGNDMTIHCYKNESHGKVDLPMSFAKSCNTSFASIGKTLNLDRYYKLCEDFLFNSTLPIDMASNPSRFVLQKGVSGVNETMQTAIGQGKTVITPLHNALIAATVANGGVMMKPYVVDHVENAEGGMVKQYTPKILAKPMTSREADYIGKMMRLVVTDGTGKKLKNMDVEAAGKTGSADNSKGKAHAWFIGYAPYENPEIVVSVIVENVGTGSEYAVPIAKKIMEAYFDTKK
ncbi:MAG TPA: penicillin-binding transpeptidase domain-containing protein [Mobilitalea sp.]|nr:penicillin-binding transpeptidase domain-containing protein [Mobilitalea sp.]